MKTFGAHQNCASRADVFHPWHARRNAFTRSRKSNAHRDRGRREETPPRSRRLAPMTQTMIQMKSKIASPSSEKVAHERLLYDSGLTPVLEISTLLGVNAHQFHAYCVQNGRSLCPKLCQPAAGSEIKAATANAPVNSPRNDDNVRQISPERQSHRRGRLQRPARRRGRSRWVSRRRQERRRRAAQWPQWRRGRSRRGRTNDYSYTVLIGRTMSWAAIAPTFEHRQNSFCFRPFTTGSGPELLDSGNMIKNRRTSPTLLAALAAFATFGVFGVAAEENSAPTQCFSTAQTREKIAAEKLTDPFAAMHAAKERVKGDALNARLCQKGAAYIYEISLVREDGRVVKALYDAATGQPFSSRKGD